MVAVKTIFFLLLFCAISFAQKATSLYTVSGLKFANIHTETEASYKLFDPAWLSSKMAVTGTDTIQILAGTNNNQTFTITLLPTSSVTIRFDSTIVAQSATLAITSGTSYVLNFYYYNSLWYLNPSIIGVPISYGSSGVTSVGLSLPSIFSVSGSPVTSTGTLTGTLTSQSQNLIFASPNGSSGTPTFRSLVAADVPTLNQNTTGTAANVTGTVAAANGGTGQSVYAIGDVLYANSTTTLTRLPIGSTNQVLEVSGGVPTWTTTSGTTATSIIDLNSPNAYLTKDTSTGSVLIVPTTKPSSPQFTYGITAANLSSNSGVLGYQAVLSIGGKNNDVSPRTLSWVATKNGTEFASSSNLSVTNADFWAIMIQWGLVDVAVGDTLGVKFWGSVASQLDYRTATFYFFPRRIAHSSGQFESFIFNPSLTNNLMTGTYVGAIGGVTYSTGSPINPNMIDSGMFVGASNLSGIMGSTLSNSVVTPFTIGYGEYLTNTITTSVLLGNNNSAASSGAFTVSTLFGFAAPSSSGGRMRLIRKWTFGIQ